MFAILKQDEICEVLRFAGVAATGVFGQTHAEGQQMVLVDRIVREGFEQCVHVVSAGASR